MITREQIKELENQEIKAKKARQDAVREFALQECPLKVGQIVDCVGWTHKGKKMKIDSIVPPQCTFDGDWRVRGHVIKKSGEVGSLTAGFSQTDYKKAAQ